MAERLAPIAFGRNGLLLPRRIIDDDSGSSSNSWASWIMTSQPFPSSLDSTVYNTCIYYDFKTDKFINNNSNIILLDNIEGADLYNVIRNASKIIAFHGMITSFAWIEKKKVLDLYDVEINNRDDYRKYRNSFYEFKPSYNNYDFIIPKKDINKTLNKMNFFFNK